jgi:hypothetical protein
MERTYLDHALAIVFQQLQILIKKLLKNEKQNTYIKDKCACEDDIKYTYECKVQFRLGP